MAATAASNDLPGDPISSSSFLSIPGRMPRSASHDSFATDLSMLSLSSFTSEVSRVRPALAEGGRDDQLEDEAERDHPEMMQYRGEMLQKMLETQNNIPIKRAHRKGNRKKLETKQHLSSSVITLSDENLLSACSETVGLANRATLYKSFSTTDLFGSLTLLKQGGEDNDNFTNHTPHHFSQTWVPPFYAQISICRRKHLEHLQTLDVSDLQQYAKDLTTQHLAGADDGDDSNSTSESLSVKHPPLPPNCKRTRNVKRAIDEIIESAIIGEGGRSGSIENLAAAVMSFRKSPKPFMRKLRFSREIGKRIRDDLLQKLGKQKRKTVTKVDLERDKGRPVTKNERNFMIFHWLQSLDDESFDDP